MPGRKPLSPPPAAVRILEATLPAPDRDMVIGDLSEQFARRVEAGRLASGIWFFAQACLFAAYSIYSTLNARRVGRLRTPADWLTRRHVMESFRTGLRQSVRRLVHDWRDSAAVILILSVGIGPAAAMLSVVENVLLRPLAYHEPERLGLLRIDLGELRNHPGLSPAEAIDMRKSGLFASVESQTRLAEVSLGPTDNLVSLSQLSFTTGTLPMLGVVPVLAVRPQIYVPIGNLFQNAGIVMVRANGDPRPMASAVIEAIRKIGREGRVQRFDVVRQRRRGYEHTPRRYRPRDVPGDLRGSSLGDRPVPRRRVRGASAAPRNRDPFGARRCALR